MILDRAGIERRVPHAGTMCLLDSVTQWDATRIACSANEPGGSHPLGRAGTVSAVVAVEYAAQAVAVHGTLLDNEDAPRPAMLAKLSNVDLQTTCIPAGCWPLSVRAKLLSHGESGCMYTFDVAGTGQRIASGRLIVAFASPSVA